MTELYENLLKATDNTNDIANEKYGVITKIDGLLCSVKEDDTGLEHSNVPILNGADLKTGDKVIIGFINNSIYNVVCYGVLNRILDINSENVIEHSALSNLGLNANSTQHQINLKIDEKINQGGGGGGIVMVGSFHIDNNGHLIATIPNGASNPYHIDSNGHLIYSTTVGDE